MRIKDLPTGSNVSSTDFVVVDQNPNNPVTRRVSVANLFASGARALPSAITPTGSPFTYQTTGFEADVIVSGGGVTLLEFSRDGTTWYSTGSFYGMFNLSFEDRVRVTYTAAPTMTLVPR